MAKRIYKDGDICGSKFNVWYLLKNGKWTRYEEPYDTWLKKQRKKGIE